MAQFIRGWQSYLVILSASLLVFSTSELQAEKLLKTNDYNIHYNAFNSSMLTPEIATLYGIRRSSSLGIINISVLNHSNKAVTAFVDGEARNPLSQLTNLRFSKTTEEEAIYYIATFNFTDKETLTFKIIIVPEGEKQMTPLEFTQQFFVE